MGLCSVEHLQGDGDGTELSQASRWLEGLAGAHVGLGDKVQAAEVFRAGDKNEWLNIDSGKK